MVTTHSSGPSSSEREHREDAKLWKVWFGEECSKYKVLGKQCVEKAL